MDKQARYHAIRKVTVVGMFINTLLAIVKILVGIIGRSPALFADGIHSLSDLISDLFVLFAARFASKEVDHNHPYGHQRIETIATVALSILLVVVGFGIAYDSIANLITGSIPTPDHYTLIAAIFSILANEWLFRYTLKTGNLINSDMLKANAWHSRSDALSSVVVLVGLIGSLFGFTFMDALAAIIVCIMIIKMGIKWGYNSIAELIDTGAEPETISKIETIIQNVEGVKDFHNLRTRKMAGQLFLDVHILIGHYLSASEGHYIGEHVRAELAQKIDDIKDIIVHIDVSEHPEKIPKLSELPPSRSELIKEITPYLRQHNLGEFIKATHIFYHQKKVSLSLIIEAQESSQEALSIQINAVKELILKNSQHIHRIECLCTL